MLEISAIFPVSASPYSIIVIVSRIIMKIVPSMRSDAFKLKSTLHALCNAITQMKMHRSEYINKFLEKRTSPFLIDGKSSS